MRIVFTRLIFLNISTNQVPSNLQILFGGKKEEEEEDNVF